MSAHRKASAPFEAVAAFAATTYAEASGRCPPVPVGERDPLLGYWTRRMEAQQPSPAAPPPAAAPVAAAPAPAPEAASVPSARPPEQGRAEETDEDRAWREAADARDLAEVEAAAKENDPEAHAATRAALRAQAGLSVGRPRPFGETLRPLDAASFLRLALPRRDMLLEPVLPERGLAMLYAPRGVGKTWAALALGLAVATGGDFLRWRAQRPRRVLYLDGEMRAEDMQHRLSLLMAGLERQPAEGFFRIACADQLEVGLPDLASREGQAEIDPLAEDSDLVILDNLSALVKGNENEQERWMPVQDWCLAQRRAGRSVLLVHHAGKSGQQRGTSRREDALDLVLALRRPPEAQAGEGARVEVHLEKCRGATGALLNPVEALLEGAGDAARWTWRELPERSDPHTAPVLDQRLADPRKKALARDQLLQGATLREASRAAGLSLSTVHKLKTEMSAESPAGAAGTWEVGDA